jgi:hypothetical protein
MKSKNIVIITALIASLIGTALAVALLHFNLNSLPEQLTPNEIANCFVPSIIVYGIVVILNTLLLLIVTLWNKRMADSRNIDYKFARLTKALGWINSLNAFPLGLLSAICINKWGQSSRIHIQSREP